MRTDMRGKDFVTLMDFTGEEIETILEVGFDLKRQNAVGAEHELLKNKTLGMIFAQPSTRTRISFETGMTQLGGHAQYYSEDNMQRKNKETWDDTGLVISRYLDALMVRLYDLENMGWQGTLWSRSEGPPRFRLSTGWMIRNIPANAWETL